MKILKYIFFVIISVFFAYNFSIIFGELYLSLLKQSAGSFLDATSLIGLPLGYVFSIIIFFTAFGDNRKYWWIGFALLPAVLFEVVFDLRHIYFSVAIGLVAWLIGKGMEFIIKKIRG